MEDRFPLHWPAGRARAQCRGRSRFKLTFARAIQELQAELERLGAQGVVLSTNVELRLDGLPRASARNPDDPGAAVYFNFANARRALACDRWDLVEHNVRAIARHVEAMRGMERWGVGTIEQAFEAYRALPARGETFASSWRNVLQLLREDLSREEDVSRVDARFRELVLARGADADVSDLKRARDDARRELTERSA